MDPLQQQSSQNKVENTVKHQVTKRQCPKKCKVIFFWVAIIASLLFLMAAVLTGVIQAVAIVVIWSIYLFFMKNFAYKDSYSPAIMIPVFIIVIIISFVVVSFKANETAPTSQESNQTEETKKLTESEEKENGEETIATNEFSKEKSSALLEKLKSEQKTVPFGKIEDQPYAEWHGEDDKVLFRGAESVKTAVVYEQEIKEIEQFFSKEGFKSNEYNEGSLVGGIAYKGFATEEVGCTIASAHYVDESKHQAEATIICWDLE